MLSAAEAKAASLGIAYNIAVVVMDGKVDAADQCAILAYEGHQVAASMR